jgi:hypothetical protein
LYTKTGAEQKGVESSEPQFFFKKKLGNNKTEEVDLAAQMKPYEGRRERETVV